jgi:hypothetical protein
MAASSTRALLGAMAANLGIAARFTQRPMSGETLTTPSFTTFSCPDYAMVSKLVDELCVFLSTRFPFPVVDAQTGGDNARPG